MSANACSLEESKICRLGKGWRNFLSKPPTAFLCENWPERKFATVGIKLRTTKIDLKENLLQWELNLEPPGERSDTLITRPYGQFTAHLESIFKLIFQINYIREKNSNCFVLKAFDQGLNLAQKRHLLTLREKEKCCLPALHLVPTIF